MGAVNTPFASILPHPLLLQLTVHVGCTAVESTVAVNVCWAAAAIVTTVGEITMSGGVIVVVAEAISLLFAFETAVTLTGFAEGTAFGAV